MEDLDKDKDKNQNININIDEKIELFGNINHFKKEIMKLTPREIFENCPIITIPINTLLFHSNIFNCDTMIANSIYPLVNENYYVPKMSDGIMCRVCKITKPHHIFPGEKPRSSEYVMNNNYYENNRDKKGKKGKKSIKGCECKEFNLGQHRLFGNFNFIGNYWLDLKNPMRGTQVFLTIKPMYFLDISSISIDLGFSLKRFSYFDNVHNKFNSHLSEFAKTDIYTKYCKENNLDGLLLIDFTDRQDIGNAEENQKKISRNFMF